MISMVGPATKRNCVMRKASRIFFGASLFLLLASIGTCFFGVRYAISRIPPEELNRIGDTDWIGVEWVLRGGILLVLAIVLSLVPPILALFRHLLGIRTIRESDDIG